MWIYFRFVQNVQWLGFAFTLESRKVSTPAVLTLFRIHKDLTFDLEPDCLVKLSHAGKGKQWTKSTLKLVQN